MGRVGGSWLLAGMVAMGCASPGKSQAVYGTGEVQAYPAGVVARAGLGGEVAGLRLSAAAGFNWTDRRDWGEHENEEGGGAGLGLRVAREGPGGRGVYGELRLDLWFLEVDWRDPGPRRGSTRIRVIQPAVGLGYGWSPGFGRIRAGAALGWEVNTHVRGEPVGEGPILLAGVAVDVGGRPRR